MIFYILILGYSITEEAARLVIKHYKRLRFGELTNRCTSKYANIIYC